MPCLDEAELIGRTIASLGFSSGLEPPTDARLVIVDNGSTDGTLAILDRIKNESAGRVHIAHEAVRGYVPPRRRGVSEAAAIAAALGFGPSDVLILQADADTSYKHGYVEAMRSAAEGVHGVIFEGATKHPPDFAIAHPDYVSAERMVDEDIEVLDADDQDEVVVDDKACGYRLDDYLAWGGLFEERTEGGDAIHAETTRMFIRARLMHGANKKRVNPAGAASSRRKIAEDPRLHYATVGLPRELAWLHRWKAEGHERVGIDEFARAVLAGNEQEATFLRRAHQLALFRYLPALVAVAADNLKPTGFPSDVEAVLTALGAPSATELAAHPGTALVQMLGLIDERPELFQSRSARR